MRKHWMYALGLAGGGLFAAAQVNAEMYVGASAGQSQIAEEFDSPVGDISLDEDDDAYKFFAGARFGLLGVEGGYVNLGKAETERLGITAESEVTGLDLFGVLNMGVGPATLFAKAGAIAWEADASVGNVSADEDGTDLAYGLGGAFHLTDAFSLRAEYEMFDANELDDLNMWSAGVELNF